MSPRLTWSNLIPGLVALGLVVAIAAAVIVFAGVGRLHGDTIRLHVVSNQARGLMNGSDVWLGGQRVGTVTDIDFLPPGADTTARVVVAVDVREDDAAQIRRNSDVQIRAGGTVIGPIVVYITAGSPTSPRVGDGDTLRAQTQSDFENASATAGLAMDEVGPIVANAKTIFARARGLPALIGKLPQRPTLPDVPRTEIDAVMTSARGALARVDSVRALLASPNSSYGRFKRDSTLGDAIAGVRDELAALRARMDSSGGTLGRLKSDSAIVRQVTNARREMAALFTDLRKRPSRYIAF